MIFAIEAGFISASGSFSISTLPEAKSVTKANSAEESISAAWVVAIGPATMKNRQDRAAVAMRKRFT